MSKRSLAEARAWYADDLAAAAPILRNRRVVEAFRMVPREAFFGPGPWHLHARLDVGHSFETPDADPAWLYHDLLVTIDSATGINNGLPSLWARVFDALDLQPGQRILQIGAGLGYYTALLAHLVGPGGHVLAYEVDPDLAQRAAEHLRSVPQVTLRAGNGAFASDLPQIDRVIACAGVTHVPEIWRCALAPGGQMMLPLTGETGWGILLHLRESGGAYPLSSLGRCGFYPCSGARDHTTARALDRLFAADPQAGQAIGSYHLGAPPDSGDPPGPWLAGPDFWISRAM